MMDQPAKSKVILVLAVTNVLFFAGMFSSCSNAQKQRSARQKEIIARLDSEEKMSKAGQEKAALEAKIAKLGKDLEEEKNEHQLTKKALLQEQLVSQGLKEELEKAIKLKEDLEQELKGASASGKPTKPR